MDIVLKTDCRYFRGDIPCKPHKQHGVHCVDTNGAVCPHYTPVTKKILIIKLGAIGDVIRTTPLLHRIKSEYPEAQIWWLTLTPDIVPSMVDYSLDFSSRNLLVLEQTHFDVVYNLDKDREACALMNILSADIKKGFYLKNGRCAPLDNDAEHKYLTGIFDDLSKKNTKSYPEEIFEICGLTFAGEHYILDNFAHEGYIWPKLSKKKIVIGLNTGCGGRWTSRLWPEKYWITLARRLKKAGYIPLLLGGEREHKKNLKIARASGARYFGHFPLHQFINLVDQCTLVVTAVTMAMHITIGLKKKIVLFNNIFNRNEFELYGLGEIIEPEEECECFFSPTCPNDCMSTIEPHRVFETIHHLLSAK
ncbi:MAG: glycosyltransferase family 9 protein [Bacteroidota bacterium]